MTAPTRADAEALDRADPLAAFRDEFVIPTDPDGRERIYLVGNSLGLLSHRARAAVDAELDQWAMLGVRGHFEPGRAWTRFHERLAEPMGRLVGAAPHEVAVMNALTVNLHLLMVSFYRPTPARHRVLIEGHAFPSDHHAVVSQITQRGYDPASSLVVVEPDDASGLLDEAAIIDTIRSVGDELAMVLLPAVQYYTGQVLDVAAITAAAHEAGATVGFDLAHAAGNVEMRLHDWDVDFAAWCTYKYLNSGPGGTAVGFVHERHHDHTGPRFEGWWGTDPDTRFEMATTFTPAPGVDAWQLSCPAILSMAPLVGSLALIDEAGGLPALRTKALALAEFFDSCLDARLAGRARNLTPTDPSRRGCQNAVQVTVPGVDGRAVFDELERRGIEGDWRFPDVIRLAPVPLYNRFVDVWDAIDVLGGVLDEVG